MNANVILNDETSPDFVACNCLPDCSSIEYDFEISHVRMTNETKDFQSEVSIYFRDDEFVAYRRYETYGRIDLLSNIGGLLGLFLGISLLSMVESIYFFTLRFFNDLWRRIPTNAM